MDTTLKDYSRATLDDIVFEGRNKAYGAFELRKLYDRHLVRAAIVAFLAFLIFVSAPLLARLLTPNEEVKVEKKMIDVNDLKEPPPLDNKPPPPPPPPPPTPPPPVVSTVKFVPPVVKKDEEVQKEEEIVKQADIKQEISTVTVKGNTDQVDLSNLDVKEASTEGIVEDKTYEYVEQMPEFPGGTGKLLEMIGKNTKYPALALRNQIEGKVYVRFVVDENGRVQNPQVTKGIGGGCDEAAMAAVKSLPAFIPGRQNGRAVKVYFSVPVNFQIK